MPDEQIRSDVATVKLLDLLVQKIEENNKLLLAKTPEGVMDALSPQRVTVEGKVIFPPARKKWFALSIVNDGPDDCWVIVNTEKSSPQPYLTRVGEAYEVDFGSAVIEDIRVYTEVGSANLRIRGTR